MAWNIGANDVANAMGTSVGSKALSLRRAVLLAAILEFAGAYLIGSEVSETIQKGIIDPTIFQETPLLFALGMMGSLLATGVLLQAASYFGLPISTTHAIVGAVAGFGAVIGGMEAVYWDKLFRIACSWIFSPLLSGVISYTLFGLIQKKILFALNPIEASQKLMPWFVFACFTVMGLSILSTFSTQWALLFSSLIGMVAALISRLLIQRMDEPVLQFSDGIQPAQAVSLEKALHHLQRVHLSNQSPAHAQQISSVLTQVEQLNDQVKKSTPILGASTQYQAVEKIFISLQILSACLVAFAHGANDVANAIGPVAAVMSIVKTQTILAQTTIPSWLLALGGGGIVIGLATWGWRVIETVGSKITELTPTRGFAAEFGAAITILLASHLGLPISTTHALIGAVLGVGMARGLKALNLQTLREIVLSWIVTIPLCALLSIAAFYFLKFCFL